jgi:copper chaperone
MDRHTYTVSGMTCAHCAMSVTQEITAIDGVTDVAVDLPTGAIAVTSDQPLDEAQVRGGGLRAGRLNTPAGRRGHAHPPRRPPNKDMR